MGLFNKLKSTFVESWKEAQELKEAKKQEKIDREEESKKAKELIAKTNKYLQEAEEFWERKSRENEENKKFIEENRVDIISTYVKGTFIDERQDTIKKVIKKIKSENEDFGYSQYEGFTNAEIKESSGEKVYQYGLESLYLARLEDEPNNEHDKNAIKVNLYDNEGNHYFVGYVPKKLTQKIKKMREDYHYFVATSLSGGKYKKQDWNNEGNEVIVTGTDEYKIEISISFWKELPESMQEKLKEIEITQQG